MICYEVWRFIGMDQRLLEADAIIFDVGNVLLTFDVNQVSARIPREHRKALHEALFGADFRWAAYDLAVESNEEISRRVAQAAGLPEAWKEVLHAYENFFLDMQPLPLTKCIPELHAMGKKLYLLTNYGEPAFSSTFAHFPFFRYFDGAVVSAREKMVKPDEAIFRLLVERYGLDPEKTLFIDDLENNIRGAQRIGLMTWHYETPRL